MPLQVGQFMKEDVPQLVPAGGVEHLPRQKQTRPDEPKQSGAPDPAARHGRKEGLDTHLHLAFLEELQHRLIDQWTFPLDNPPEGKMAAKKVRTNECRPGQPKHRQNLTECQRRRFWQLLSLGKRLGSWRHRLLN